MASNVDEKRILFIGAFLDFFFFPSRYQHFFMAYRESSILIINDDGIL